VHELSRELPNAHRIGVTVSDGIGLPAAFEQAVLLHHDRPALGASRWQPTYGELNAAANRIAHALLRHSCGLEDRVAILMQHDTPAIAAVLAALKAGKVVSVLNPTHPAVRLRQLIEDLEPAIIVTDTVHLDLATEIADRACAVVRFEDEIAQGPDHNPSLVIGPDQTACLVYTSGSAGSPKAVMKTHRQLLHSTYVKNNAMGFTASDRIPLFGSLSSGQGINLIWSALLNGAQLCPFPMIQVGTTGLRAWMIDQQITVYISSPSVFRSFCQTLEDDTVFPLVHALHLGSEAATSDDFKLFQKHFSHQCTFVHPLSSSETSVIAVWRSSAGDNPPEGRLPVGTVAAGTEILIVDEGGRPVRRGAIGEIIVLSRYMAAGYWRQPALTAERFSGPLGGVRRFRTGDMGRINAKGQLEFVGRRDARLKIRGHRIELSEVECALQRLPGVKQAVVEVIARENKEPVLVGYITADEGHSWSRAGLRTKLRSLVPDYMVPSLFLLLESFPLAPNGKIDREKLRETYQSFHGSKSTASMTTTELLIAKFWADALDLHEIGRDDDFFELGGDSLIASVVAARLHTILGVEIGLETFADYPKLAAFAKFVDGADKKPSADVKSEIAPTSRASPIPLSYYQEHWWLAAQTQKEFAGQAMAHSYRMLGALDIEVLRDCMTYLVGRHEVLRTSFAILNGVPIQVIHPPAEVQLPYLDLSGTSDAEARAQLLFKAEAARGFDVSVPPLLRHQLVKIAENEHLLLRTNHHIITDGPSWNMYYRELAQLYDARIGGADLPPPNSGPSQYADYVNWQRHVLLQGGERNKDQIAWWKGLFLHEPPPLNLPFQRAEPLKNIDPIEGFIPWGLEPEVSRRLNELGQKESATYYIVRLAAFAALLAAETGQRDVVIGTYVNCRKTEADRKMLGLFTNPVTIILNCDLTSTFREWLSVVRQHFLAVQAHADMPYEWLRRELDKHKVVMPEIRAILAVRTPLRGPLRFAGVEMRSLERPLAKMPSGFIVGLEEEDQEQGSSAHFDAGKYDPAGVRHLIGRFKRLLDAVSRQPDVPIHELLGLSASQVRKAALAGDKAERASLLERNRALTTRLRESEADRAARLEQINILTNALKKSEAELTDRLNESEADRAARLEQINILTSALKESEADRAARLKVIGGLTDRLNESEADRAARLQVIERLTSRLNESDADRAARLEQINILTNALKASETDRAALLEQVDSLTNLVGSAKSERGRPA
jgi:amino acid adenylation domain-containing protein